MGMFGGILYIPEFDFMERFFRLPVIGWVLTLTYRGV